MEAIYASLTQRPAALQQQQQRQIQRTLIALAGPLGSGKTTTAKRIAK